MLKFLIILSLFYLSSCSSNLYESFSEPTSKEQKLEQARTHLDNNEYNDAEKILVALRDGGNDSNEVRILLTAAYLGQAGFEIISIIDTILNDTKDQANSTGIDRILEAFSDTLLGSGETRTKKLNALKTAIENLRGAPESSATKIANTACFLAGIFVVPKVKDTKTALTDTETALNTIKNGASDGGNSCPDINQINAPFETLKTAAQDFALTMQAISSCSFLNFNDVQSSLNAVEKQLNKVLANADKGCDGLPSCPASNPACNALFPPCVQAALGVGTASSAKAGDKKIDGCEFAIYCSEDAGACFN